MGVPSGYTSAQVVQAVPVVTSSGLNFISKTAISATTQVNLTNVFSSSYDFYSVRFSNLSTGAIVNMRYGTAGTPDTASTYSNLSVYTDSANVFSSDSRFNASSNMVFRFSYVSGSNITIEIQNPFLTVNTYYQGFCASYDTNQINTQIFNGVKGTATSYTDLVLFSISNFSGDVSIYGYANS